MQLRPSIKAISHPHPSRSNLEAQVYLLKLCEASLPQERDPLPQMASPACCSLQCLSVKRLALFLLLVSVYASLFDSRLSDAGRVADMRDYSGGKRALSGLDEEVEEDPLPKKKKSPVSIKEGEETQVWKKKKVGAVTEGSDEEKPKKKKATVQDLDEENATKKKKKFAAADADHADGDKEVPLKKNKKAITKTEVADGDEEVPLKKNKKATTKTEAEVDDDQLPKKKKKVAIDEEEENQATQKKKKKSTMEELDKPKKKMTPQEVEAADTEGKPLKKKKITSMVDNEEEVEEKFVKKKKKLTPMEDNEEEVEEQSLTKKKKLTEDQTGTKPKNQTKPIKLTTNSTIKPAKPKTKLTTPKRREEGEDGDLITEFRDLPSKLATSIIPDLERISTTSKVYLKKANKEISQSFKPLVGPKYASLIASFASYLFLLGPIVIFPLLYARIRNYFLPLQTIVVFIHIYLAIYFSVLSLSYLVTGQEPLRFFYSTSKASFVYTQLLQTMGYALYLLVLVVHLVVVFSSKDAGAAPRALGLAQMMVGLAVGAHYYVAVAHRAVLREPPLTNWKVHAGYAALFVGVCLLARAERRKKAYLHEGREDGKTS